MDLGPAADSGRSARLWIYVWHIHWLLICWWILFIGFPLDLGWQEDASKMMCSRPAIWRSRNRNLNQLVAWVQNCPIDTAQHNLYWIGLPFTSQLS
jgi:hypothetical protein